MSAIHSIRAGLFWTLDAARGAPIRLAVEQIRHADSVSFDDPWLAEHQQEAWAALRNHVRENVPFYRDCPDALADFPVVDKNTLRTNMDAFFSRAFDREKLFQMSTSGSTGTPFVSYQDLRKKQQVRAEVIYYSQRIGYRLGSNLSYIRNVVRQISKSPWKQFVQNQSLVNFGKLDDPGIEAILGQLRRISRTQSITLLGYASTYAAIRDYALRHGIARFDGIRVTGIISGSDMLFDEIRDAMRRLFDCRNVVSRYSNEENGIIGQDSVYNNVFEINEASYLVEILDEAGRPVQDGTQGHIVVTDLYNHARPFIRYDTGDIGAVRVFEIDGLQKRCICDFSGRVLDVIYDSDDRPCSPYMVSKAMWSFPEISQFQFIQRGRAAYLLKLNCQPDEAREPRLLAALKPIVGEDARIDFEYVSEIPVLHSGKRRYIVNEYRKK